MTDTTREPPDLTSALLPHEQPLAPRWDFYIGVVWLAVGLAIFGIAISMPTFYERMQQLYTAPGLVPSVYGGIITLLSIWLIARSIARGAFKPHGNVDPHPAQPSIEGGDGNSNFRLFLAALLCLVYTVILIGHMPFWLATAIFVAGFILVFEYRRDLTGADWTRKLAIAAAIGVGTGIAVWLLFERVFLVRLP